MARELILTAEAQHLPAGHQEFEHRAGRQQLHQGQGRCEHLLEIVQDEQGLLVAQVGLQVVERHLIGVFLHAQRLGHGREDQSRVTDGCQGNEVDAMRKVLAEVYRRLQA